MLPLTGPEQHRPVEPGGLGGHPCPLAQPLRHAPARPTAEPTLSAGSARCSGVPSRQVSAAEARTRRGSGYQRGGRRARRRRGGGTGARARVGLPARQPAGRGEASGPRSRVQGENRRPDSQVASHLLYFLPLAAGPAECWHHRCGVPRCQLGMGTQRHQLTAV